MNDLFPFFVHIENYYKEKFFSIYLFSQMDLCRYVNFSLQTIISTLFYHIK